VRSRKCACPKAAAFLTRQQLHRALLRPWNSCILQLHGRASCARLVKVGALRRRQRAAPSPPPRRCAQRRLHTSGPSALFVVVCGLLCAATAAAKVLQQGVLAAQSHAHARAGRAGASRTSASHSPFEPFTVRSRAHPGCGRTAQRPQRRLPSWASRPLILGRCERCLAGSGCFLVCHLLHMQECRHAEGMQRCLCMQLV